MYHSYGWEARKKQEFKKAIQFYNKAIDLNPHHFKAIFNRGFAFDKLGEIDKAIRDYKQALQIQPNNAFCFYNLGISLDKKGLPEEAVKIWICRLKILVWLSKQIQHELTSTAIEDSHIVSQLNTKMLFKTTLKQYNSIPVSLHIDRIFQSLLLQSSMS